MLTTLAVIAALLFVIALLLASAGLYYLSGAYRDISFWEFLGEWFEIKSTKEPRES